MSLVGIIANPSAGKDIRRIVAHGRFVPNYEKANIIRRILAGISATPAKRVLMMPDSGMLCHTASRDLKSDLHTDFIEMHVRVKDDINIVDSIYDVYYENDEGTQIHVAHYWYNGDSGSQIHWVADQPYMNWSKVECA